MLSQFKLYYINNFNDIQWLGYHGENCEHILHTCDTINCLNNGHCQINGPDGLAVCQCIDGFDGSYR